MNSELWISIGMMFLFSIIYGFIGLIVSEPKSRKFLTQCCRKKQALNSSRNSFEHYHDNEDEISESGLKYIKEINELDDKDENYVLIAKGINKQYPAMKDRKALDGFHLAVQKGQVFGLLGPNGAGKTSFQKILTGTETADNGEAFINGIDIKN